MRLKPNQNACSTHSFTMFRERKTTQRFRLPRSSCHKGYRKLHSLRYRMKWWNPQMFALRGWFLDNLRLNVKQDELGWKLGETSFLRHSFWVIYYKSLTWMFRPFWVGFPYFSLPFGVTNRRFGRYILPRWFLDKAHKWFSKWQCRSDHRSPVVVVSCIVFLVFQADNLRDHPK